MQEIPADRLPAMFFEPATHLLVGPGPFKGVGIEPIILRSCSFHLVYEFLTTVPGTTFQVVKTEGAVQHLPLIEPRSMNRRETRPPPTVTLMEIGFRRGSRVTRVAILDQVHPLEPTMPAPERRQSFRGMKRVLFLHTGHRHL